MTLKVGGVGPLCKRTLGLLSAIFCGLCRVLGGCVLHGRSLGCRVV
jgi:hypothetical protein